MLHISRYIFICLPFVSSMQMYSMEQNIPVKSINQDSLYDLCRSDQPSTQELSLLAHQKNFSAMCSYKGDCDSTPLHELCENKNITLKFLELLLLNGAEDNVNDTADCNDTPLHTLCHNSQVTSKLLNVLLHYGAKDSINTTTISKYTALHLLCNNTSISTDMLTTLLKSGAKTTINSQNDDGDTQLHVLCRNENVNTDLLTTLIQNGATASICIKNKDGNVPLHIFCMNPNTTPDMISVFLSYKNAVDTIHVENNMRRTPLDLLRTRNGSSHELIKVFLDKK